jgi:hypothetical protein
LGWGDMAERFLYRGTTRGWPGGGGPQAVRRTPTTTDPLVATLFAIECCRHGLGIVHAVSARSVAGQIVLGNVLSGLECEIGLSITPLEFESHSIHWIRADAARSILAELGFQLPITISTRLRLRNELKESLRLTESQIVEFHKRFMR